MGQVVCLKLLVVDVSGLTLRLVCGCQPRVSESKPNASIPGLVPDNLCLCIGREHTDCADARRRSEDCFAGTLSGWGVTPAVGNFAVAARLQLLPCCQRPIRSPSLAMVAVSIDLSACSISEKSSSGRLSALNTSFETFITPVPFRPWSHAASSKGPKQHLYSIIQFSRPNLAK